jgi:DNA-binding FrmR family transcriptional regulator
MSKEMPQRGTPHHDEINRLRRIEGQVRGLQRMIEEDRYCIDILTQIRSVSRAIDRVADSILQRHLRHCVTHAVHSGDEAAVETKIEEIITVLERAR